MYWFNFVFSIFLNFWLNFGFWKTQFFDSLQWLFYFHFINFWNYLHYCFSLSWLYFWLVLFLRPLLTPLKFLLRIVFILPYRFYYILLSFLSKPKYFSIFLGWVFNYLIVCYSTSWRWYIFYSFSRCWFFCNQMEY